MGARMERVALAMDGSPFRVRGDLADQLCGFIQVAAGESPQEFYWYTSPGGSFVSTTGMRARLSDTYEYQGRPVLVGASGMVRHDGRQYFKTAVFQGENFDLLTHRYWVWTSEILASVTAFELIEEQHGIRLVPRSGKLSPEVGPSVINFTPGIGVSEFAALSDRTAPSVPKWRGTRTAKGNDLYIVNRGERSQYFLLVGGGAVGTLVPPPDHDEARLLQVLDELEVEWLDSPG